jgi:general secretion pathway protein G
MKNHHQQTTKAFTLLELMIVIVIMGMLATIVMPKILNRPEQARRTKATVEIKNIEDALALFNSDTKRFPTTSEGLAILTAESNHSIEGYQPDGYLTRSPVDPWGKPYIYISPGVHGKNYDLESYGKDGEDGGAGDDADIENWNIN